MLNIPLQGAAAVDDLGEIKACSWKHEMRIKWMLEWDRLQLMITNYPAKDDGAVFKLLNICAALNTVTWS